MDPGSDIIAWARNVIESDPKRPVNRQRLVAAEGALPGETAMLAFPSQTTEARGVADLVQRLMTHEGLAASDILIMSRSDYNGQFSKPVKDELAARDIAVDDPSWVDAVMSEDANRTLLLRARLLADPNDSLAWAGLLRLEHGIGRSFLTAIYDRAVDRRVRFGEALLTSFQEEFSEVGGRARIVALDLIERTLGWLDENEPPETLEDEAWGDWLKQMFAAQSSPVGMSDELADLLDVIDLAVPPGGALGRYLGQIQPLGKDHAQAQSSGVRFMSMALSKGLTVDASIIIGAEEGIIPDRRADEGEERRLLYVSLTRARRYSFVTWANRRTGPTARSGDGRVQAPRTETRFLRNGPVQTQQGQDFIQARWP